MNYSNFSKFFPVWLVLAVIAVLPNFAQAEAAANVHFATGYVTATAANSTVRELAKGHSIFSKDTIDTAENARVQMRFTDGGLVSLMPNSTFTVEEYLYEGGAEDDSSLVFGMLRGGLRTVTGAIGKVKHDQYELKTPVATLGIRGTEFTAVLMPANTLRVHVGRGKVVITNDQGTLEVPEGRNAVVTLGNAPEYSEQGPQYQASGVSGDRLYAAGDIRQDPNVLDPMMNMPDSTIEVNALGPEMMALAVYDSSSSVPSKFLSVVSPDDVIGTWTKHHVGSSGDLNWGYYAGSSGSVGSTPISTTDDLMHYVTGPSTLIGNVPSGMLSFSLEGHSGDGNVALSKFDLGIDLASLDFSLDFGLDDNGTTYIFNNISGNLNAGSNASSFGFTQTNLSNDSTGTGMCNPCNLDVSGFLAGSNANQAGVSYILETGSSTTTNMYTGAAALSR